MSWKKIIILFVVLFIIGSGLITYLWYQARQASGVDVTITAPAFAEIGVPFIAKVAVVNAGPGVARETSLSLSLPEGFVFMTEPASKKMVSKSLGSLGSGTVTNQEFRIMPVSGENSLVQLSATLTYVPTDLGSRFEKTTVAEISIGESGISLDIQTPQKVFAGEQFEIKIDYENESVTEFFDLQLMLEYPRGFRFISSTLPPDEDSNVWKLGNLRAGSKGSFTVKGELSGLDGAFFDFAIGIKTAILGRDYVINQKTASVSVAPSPLAVSITVNDEVDYKAEPGESLVYEITYRNNTDIGLKDAIITAKLIGDMFDFASLNSREGVFRSSDNTVQWNAAREPDLEIIPPGGSGSVAFTVRTYRGYEISRISDKNFVLKVLAEIESPTVPASVASNKTSGSTSIETKVGGELSVTDFGARKDSSGITNTGPMPLKVGQETTFTMHWVVRNGTTDMDDVKIKTFLGPNVRYTGQFVASNNVAPTYNERTQEFVWNPGRVQATKGYIDAPLELVFQVGVTPSSDQVGQYPTLLGETTVTATDAFVGVSVFDKLQAFATVLIKEPPFTTKDFSVEP